MAAPRILYVDDDDGLRRLTQRAMARRGFTIEVADCADAGLARLRAERFDLVAIDQNMPGKSGRQMLDEIVRLPDHPPVVFVTGNDDTATAVEALHAGALDFVVKIVGDTFFDLLDSRFRQALSRGRLEADKRAAEADLRAANERLEILVREVHHRVANSLQMVLSFVGMQANRTDSIDAREALGAIQNRIRAIAKIHHRLYTRDDVTTIDLDAYLQTLADELGESLDRDDVTIALDTQPVVASTDTAVSVGVIVNELVSNAAKYAFAGGQGGTIRLILRALEGDTFCVAVEDDGGGIDDAAAPQGTGLGSRIIQAVARSLDTTVEQVPTACGTRMEFVVRPRQG